MSSKRKNSEDNEGDGKRRQSFSDISKISRSISACQRCRIKKIKCDQNFPRCAKCEKAGVDCVGLDSVTRREIPRSYIMYLENKVTQLEEIVRQNGVFNQNNSAVDMLENDCSGSEIDTMNKEQSEVQNNSNDKHVSFQDNDGSLTYLNSNSEVSFPKLMFTALRVNKGNKKHDSIDQTVNFENGSSLPAILPPKKTAQEFLKIFFAQSNSQLPIFHREEFILKYFIPIYGNIDDDISLASNNTSINFTFFQNKLNMKEEDTWFFQYKMELQKQLQNNEDIDPSEISNNIVPPKKFHKPLYFLSMVFAISCSVHHLQYHSNISNSFKIAANKYFETTSSSEDKLESLQCLLLFTLYSIMRPTAPGVWYILGVALRICVDLGLHKESLNKSSNSVDLFTEDKKRRLFWCTYSLDRQICFYLGKPVGIPEESINTPFPSVLDDAMIDKYEFKHDLNNDSMNLPTYKNISIAFFNIRRLQGEVQRILYENSEVPRKFADLNQWKADILERLKTWKLNLPKTDNDMNCDFNLEFFNLNYNHTVLMIHGLSPKNNNLSITDFIRLLDASKEIIHCYKQLHSSKCINYTWAAVHNLFLAGTCYLYAIYNSDDVFNENSLSEVKKVSQECIHVLNSLIDKCEAAYNCRHSFEVLTAAVVKIKYNEIVQGFDSNVPTSQQISNEQSADYSNKPFDSLVQNIDGGTNHNFAEQDIQLQTDIVDNYFHFASHLNSKMNEIGERDSMQKLPSTFEWVSIGNSTDPHQETHIDLQTPGNDLVDFFDHLDRIPIESINYQVSKNKINNQAISYDDSTIPPIDSYDSTPALTNGQGKDEQSHQKGEKRPHEFQEAPIDSIWDQFLTSVTPALGLNSVFMLNSKSEAVDRSD